MKQFVLIFLSAFFAHPSALWAQNTILKKINEIKSQNATYYWNEYTHPNADTAIVNAAKWMLNEINANREEQLELSAIMPKVRNIKMERGNLTRAFVYISRSDVPTTNSTTTDASADATLQPSATAPANIPSVATSQAVTEISFVPDAFTQRIMGLGDFYRVYNFLREQKLEGQVLQFGALKDVEDYSSLDLILFDMQSKRAISLLSPVTQGTQRTNLTTGNADSLDNYPEDMVLVIWYIK